MSEMRELLDTELDAVCGGCRRGHEGNQGNLGHFDLRNNGGFNFGNIVIQENIVEQVGLAVGNNASVTNLLGSQTNSSSIASNIGDFNFGNLVNFGKIVIQENIVEQIGVAIGNNASVTNLVGSQTNFSSIGSDPLSHLAALQAPP
jgi:hypothetical protein